MNEQISKNQIIKNRIDELQAEIERDREEIANVPDRFATIIKSELDSKINRLNSFYNELDRLVEGQITDRLQKPLVMLQEILNTFLNDYEFEYPKDKAVFIKQVFLENIDDTLSLKLKPIENERNTYGNRLKVTIDNHIIQENKTTDTFIKALQYFSIDEVKALAIVELGVPLIADYNDNRYQQKKISNNLYVLTHISTTKKKEVLEYIASRFNKYINVEII